MKRSFDVVARRDGTIGGLRGIAYLCYTGEEILSVIEKHKDSTISFIGRMAIIPVEHHEFVDGIFKIETDKGTRSINIHQIVVFVSERGDHIILLPIMKFLLTTGIEPPKDASISYETQPDGTVEPYLVGTHEGAQIRISLSSIITDMENTPGSPWYQAALDLTTRYLESVIEQGKEGKGVDGAIVISNSQMYVPPDCVNTAKGLWGTRNDIEMNALLFKDNIVYRVDYSKCPGFGMVISVQGELRRYNQGATK